MNWTDSDAQARETAARGGKWSRGVFYGMGLALAVLAALVVAIASRPHVRGLLSRGTGGEGLETAPPGAWAIEPLTGDGPAAGPGDLQGKVVLVNFWGTWCPPCRRELPELVKLYHRFRSRPDFRFLAVSCPQRRSGDIAELRRDTADFLAGEGYDIPSYADPSGRTRQWLTRIGAFRDSYPTTMLLDRRGVVVAVWEGVPPGTIEDVQQTLVQYLDDPGGEP